MDLLGLESAGSPVPRTAASVGDCDDLNFSCCSMDLTDGVIEFRDESICSSGIAFGIPLVGSLCLSDRLRMEPNAWSGQRIVRGSGAASRTRERSYFSPI
jgi:hypothetical protein